MEVSIEEIFPNKALARAILSCGKLKKLQAQSLVYSEGDPCSGVGLLLDGLIRVFKIGQSGREITLYEVHPGQTCILNAFCVLSGKHYPASAETLTETKLILIPAGDFIRIFQEYEPFRKYIFHLLSERIATIMELIEEVAFGRMDQRLWEYITQKAQNKILKRTHQDIANDLGTSREVVSRLLKDFERKGLIRLSRATIEIL